jgi:Integrase core domain
VPQRRRRKRLGASTAGTVPIADAPNAVWTVDFQFDATTDGRPVKIVSIVDEHTRECLGGLVDRNITSDDLIVELDRLAALRGYPAVLRCDNGPELACAAMADWAGGRTGLHFIPPGQPLAQRLHRVVQRPGPRRMPQHQHVLVTGAGAGGDQRLEGRLQPPPTAQRPRLPGPSGLRCSLQPPMNDRCLDPHTVARFVGQVFVSNVGGSWPYGWNQSAVSCGTYVTCSGRGRCVLRAAGGPVDLDRYPLRGGPRFHQLQR